MQATRILEGRGGRPIGRLLGLLCAMLLLTLGVGCHDAATTAGQESETSVEMASEGPDDSLAKVTGEVGPLTEETDPTAEQIAEVGPEPIPH